MQQQRWLCLILLSASVGVLVEANFSKQLLQFAERERPSLATESSERPGPSLTSSFGCRLCRLAPVEALYLHDEDPNDERRTKQRQLTVTSSRHSCITRSLVERGYTESYGVHIPRDIVEEQGDVLESGLLFSCLPEAFFTKQGGIARIHLPAKYEWEVWTIGDESHGYSNNNNNNVTPPRGNMDEPHHDRMLQTGQQEVRQGTKRLLAIRVSTVGGEEPLESLEEIEGAIFGTGLGSVPAVTLVDQYAAVSHNALKYVPATGPGIRNGVREISIDDTVVGGDIKNHLSTLILDTLEASIGPIDDVADYTIFCIPNGSYLQTSNSWTAFTYLFETYSIYQRSRCTRLSVLMHEMGHGLGYRHSGMLGDAYLDESGYMGYAVNQKGYPLKAFNGHKHWMSGWLINNAIEIDPIRQPIAFGGRLVSFVDYGRKRVNQNDAAVLRVGDLYIQYNLAKDYNLDTYFKFKDKVTITQASSLRSISNHKAALVTGGIHRIENYMNSGRTLIVEVCDMSRDGRVDFASVSIHMEGLSSICTSPNGFGKDLSPDASTRASTILSSRWDKRRRKRKKRRYRGRRKQRDEGGLQR